MKMLGLTVNSVVLIGILQIAASVTTFQQQMGSVWWASSLPSHHQNVSDGGRVNK